MTEAELTFVRMLIVDKEAAERDYADHKFGAAERLSLANMGLAGWSRKLLQHITELEQIIDALDYTFKERSKLKGT